MDAYHEKKNLTFIYKKKGKGKRRRVKTNLIQIYEDGFHFEMKKMNGYFQQITLPQYRWSHLSEKMKSCEKTETDEIDFQRG